MSLRWRGALVLDIALSTVSTLLNVYIITRFYKHPLTFVAATRVVRGCLTTGGELVRPMPEPLPALTRRVLAMLAAYVVLVGASIGAGMYVIAHMPIATIMVVDALYPCVLLLLDAAGACLARLRPAYAPGPVMDSDEVELDEPAVMGIRHADLPAHLRPRAPKRPIALHAARAAAVVIITLGSVLTVVGPEGAPLGWAAVELATLFVSAAAAYVYNAWMRQPGWVAGHIARLVIWPEVALMGALAAAFEWPASWRQVGMGFACAAVYSAIDTPRWRVDLYVRMGEGAAVDPVVMSVIGNVTSLAVICCNIWITGTTPTALVVLGIGASIVGVLLFTYAAARLARPVINAPVAPPAWSEDT